MTAYTTNRRRRPAARNPGVIVHKLLWSMSYRRRVRITLRDGRVRTEQVSSIWRDESVPIAKLPRQASTVGVVFEAGPDLRVDAIERVQLPLGTSGAAFGEDS